jgi:hypothetical protein
MPSQSPLPLLAIPPPRNRSHFEASLEARRALTEVEARDEDTFESELLRARARVIAQLQSVAECVGQIARNGIMHASLDASDTLQTTPRLRNGEWTASTVATRMPPPAMLGQRFDPEVCNATMNAMVVMSVLRRDAANELIEYRELASMLAAEWPQVDVELDTRLREAWPRRHAPAPAPEDAPGDARGGGGPVQALSRAVYDATRRTGAPATLEAQAAHALDHAQRTLQWLGDGAAVLVEALDE